MPSSTPIPTPLILVANDDGVDAPGLAELDRAMRRVGETLVCTTAVEQSAKSHAISVHRAMTLSERRVDGRLWAHALDGLPADCVKFALNELLKDRKPDLVVSGINRGRNTGTNILYSGTVAAAAEGGVNGIPALAVSLAAKRERVHLAFETAAIYAERYARHILEKGLPPNVVLNVNVPDLPPDEIRGVRVTRMSRSMFLDRFEREESHGAAPAYLNVGDKMVFDLDRDDNDDAAIRDNCVSVTPLRLDWTDAELLERLSGELNEEF